LPRTGTANVGRALDPLADGVVEDEDPVRLQLCLEEGFDGGIIDAGNFLIVIEIPDHGRMPHQRKALAIERNTVRDRARIEDRKPVGFGECRGFRFARRRIEGVGSWLFRSWREIVEFGGNKRQRLDFCLLKAHGNLLDSICWLI
jgi:hypothetical protein